MSVLVVGLHQRSVPLETLERVAVSDERLGKVLAALIDQPQVSEAIVISTCMRIEVYATVERFHPAVGEVRDVLAAVSGVDLEELSDFIYSYWDHGAVAHLFEVAAGLDSAVLGEGEILSQVRNAWERARAEGSAGSSLSDLFRRAIEVGKRARSETGISRGATSISAAAVALAASELGSLRDRLVVVLGAGEMGTGMAQALAGAGADIAVINRTLDKARELADKVGGRPLALGELHQALVKADVLLASAQASSFLVDTDDIAAVVAERQGRPLLVVDVALPRSVDPNVAQMEGITLLGLEELRRFAERGRAERKREGLRVAEIVTEEVERYLLDTEARRVVPLIRRLHTQAESMRQAELAHYRARLGPLDEKQATAVDALTKAIVAKLLHSPTVALKESAGSPKGERVAETITDLFDL